MTQALPDIAQRLPQEGPAFSGKLKLAVAALVVVAAFGYLAFLAFQSATVYYHTVSEIADLGPTPEGKVVRVSGKLNPASFTRSEGETVATFSLTEGDQVLRASYDGVVPDLFFNENSDIILEGRFDGSEFVAQNVIVKCPSKYVAAD